MWGWMGEDPKQERSGGVVRYAEWGVNLTVRRNYRFH